MRISFLACNKNAKYFRRDPSFIYRCESLAAALADRGVAVELKHLSQLSGRNVPDWIVFHRPRFSMRFLAVVRWLKFRGCHLIVDFDDLVFDPKYSAASPAVLNGILKEETVAGNYRSHQKALQYFDVVTVSTSPLKEYVLRLFPEKHVVVLPNAVHQGWRQRFDGDSVPAVDFQHPVITYLPGTRSHDRDFKVFATELERFLNDHPRVKLQVTGPLQFSLSVRPEQVVHREKVPFTEYHSHISHGWVNLAPLEVTPFTRCKSALKVIEAGYWGKPTLCSPIPDVERLAGQGAITVAPGGELYHALSDLLKPAYYQSYTLGLRERLLRSADVYQRADEFCDMVRGCG